MNIPGPLPTLFARTSIEWEPFLFGAVIHITIFFAYLMPFGSPPALAAVACALVIFSHVYRYGTLDGRALFFFLVCITIVMWGLLLRVILVDDWGESLRGASYYVSGAFLVLATTHVVQGNSSRLASLFGGLLFITVIALVISFANYYTSLFLGVDFLVDMKRAGTLAQYHRSRMMGTVGNPNNFAAALIVPFVILLASLVERVNWQRAFFFVLCSAALIFASSRGVLLGIAVICPFAVWQATKKHNTVRFVSLLLLPMIMSTGLLVMGDEVERVAQLLDRIYALEGKASIGHRFEIWSDYLSALGQNPGVLLFGNGLGNFLVDQPPENGYLKLVNEFGIPVALAFVLFVALLCYKLHQKQGQSIAARTSFYLVVTSMMANISNEVIDGRSFWLALGIAYACVRLSTCKAEAVQHQ